jgi:hypothetical protein
MSNPKSVINFNKFEEWKKQRDKFCDWEDYVLQDKLALNKMMAARDMGLDRKRITENKKIYKAWLNIEENLRLKGILEINNQASSQKLNRAAQPSDKTKTKALPEKSADTENELQNLKQQLEKSNKKLKKLEMLEEYLMQTGKL